VFAACTPEPPQECLPADAPWVDFDQDGYPASVDCNDSDPTIHPGAFELCDFIDNNCDGRIDEGYPHDDDGFPDCEPVEICDGIDNNYNGLVDEGFPDFDGDGVADCVDDHCEVFLDFTSREIPIDEDCTEGVIEVEDPWNVRIEWQWKDGSSTAGSFTTPVVGRFLDTNGDGVVDFADVPIVATTMFSTNKLVGLRGDTGELVYEVSGVSGYGGVMLVDADGDGEVEAVAFDASRRVIALDRFGRTKWTSTLTESNTFPHAIIADVDADGVPEIITQSFMISGRDGSTITNFGAPAGIPTHVPTVGDIDLDGVQEIFIGRNVYRPDGSIKWSHGITGNAGHWMAIVNIDDDPEGELIVVGASRIGMYEHDGTEIRVVSTSAAERPGPICIADFDGDGMVELAWTSRGIFAAIELDGTIMWSTSINDTSGLVAGCAGFDINGDGQYEIVHADVDVFRIWDGKTGTRLFEIGGHRSSTIIEYPTIADIDGDGNAEILIVSNSHASSWGSVTAFGHAGDGWPPSGETWPVHDFAVTNINPDGTVPEVPAPSWQVHNVCRARPSADTISANLGVEITDACVSGCVAGVGMIALAVEVFNTGASDIYIDVPVTIFRPEGSELVPLDTQWFRGGVPGGTRIGGVEFVLPIEDLTDVGFVVRVDDRGRGVGNVAECNEDDNQTAFPYPVCD
jgi:hypothetical protein